MNFQLRARAKTKLEEIRELHRHSWYVELIEVRIEVPGNDAQLVQ